MKKRAILVSFLLLFLAVGIVLNHVSAKEVEDSEDSSDSGSNEDSDDSDDDDSNDNSKEDVDDSEDEEDENEVETETETEETSFDEFGNKIIIKTETKTKDGETETTIKRKIIDSQGNEITIKIKTKTENGKEETVNSIVVEGAEVETKLTVKEKTEEGVTKFKVQLSTGAEQNIIVLPDEALQIAFEELQASNNFSLEITEETNEEGELKAVFSAKGIQKGRFLGIFNTNVDLETLIDTETGEIIKTNRPWWAGFVIVANESTICHLPSDDPNKRVTLTLGIPAVKAHLQHGDSLGECIPECGDGILVEGKEACDDSNTLEGDGCSSTCQIEITENPTATILENTTIPENTTDIAVI